MGSIFSKNEEKEIEKEVEMKQTLKSGRILLEDSITQILMEKLAALKEESCHVKASPSKFVCTVLDRYFDEYFDKDKSEIVKALFDEKDILKKVLTSTNSVSGALAELAEYQTKLASSKKKRLRDKGKLKASDTLETAVKMTSTKPLTHNGNV